MVASGLLSTALIAGMIAAFNPCGFAMLPAYLAYFVGSGADKSETNRAKNIFKALVVGLTMSVAFVSLFGLFGVVASTIISESAVQEKLQWATFILGILMIPLGVWMTLGKEINLKIPRFQKGGRSDNLGSIFLFGISFAIVSLGCTAGPFFAIVVGSFTSDSWFDGVQLFIAYGLGMSLIVMFLTLATGLARTEIAVLMRRILPHIGKISGVFLILTGVFLTIYGWWEIQILNGNITNNWLTDTSGEFQSSVSNWISEAGAGRLAVAMGILIAGAVVWAGTSFQSSGAVKAGATDSEKNGSEEKSADGEKGANGEKSAASEKIDNAERQQLLVWRYGMLGVLAVLWLVLEIVSYGWELMILPVYRMVIDLPSRVWDWFSNPLSWGVFFEILFTAFIATIVVLQIRRKRAKKLKGANEDPPEGEGANEDPPEGAEKRLAEISDSV